MEATGSLGDGDLRVTLDAAEVLALPVAAGDAGKTLRDIVVAAALLAGGGAGDGSLVGFQVEAYLPLGIVVRFDPPVADPTGSGG